MFGYILPVRSKLNDSEWSDYRAAYCGLCHTLNHRYGFFSRFLLNYDCTFLTLLLRCTSESGCVSCRRCISSPIRGRSVSDEDDALCSAADITVLLIYWKLRDQLADEHGIKKIYAAALLLFMHGVFQKGKNNNPDLYHEIGAHIGALSKLEAENCPSIDRTADEFAHIISAATPQKWDKSLRRETEQLLYHLGRWIYLIDAWDDLEDDLKHGRYNPIAARFCMNGLYGSNSYSEVKTAAQEQIERTICHSENLAISAFNLGDYGYYTPILENILCAGLQNVRQLVFSGMWKKYRYNKKQEYNRK